MKYQYKKIKSKCPLCKTEDANLLYEIDSHNVSRYLATRGAPEKTEKIKKHIERLWGSKLCKKISCSNCKLMYWSPFRGGDEDFYSEAYSSFDKYPDWRWEYGLTINELKKIKNKKNLSMIEIGAGRGAFFKKLPFDLIKKENRYANEIANTGITELHKIGIKNYKNLALAKGKTFSIICMFDSIEHIDNLDNLFQNISRISIPSTQIFISTHVPETTRLIETKGIGLDLSPTHVSCWDEESFKFLEKKYGLKIIDRKLLRSNFFQRMIAFGFGKFEYNKIKEGSLESKFNNVKIKKYRKFLIYLYLAISSPYAIYGAIMNKNIYSCQWIHLQKI